MANSNTAQFTTHQFQVALEVIEQSADTAQSLCVEALANPNDVQEQAPILDALKTTLQQIGWIAAHHSGNRDDDPRRAFLPPSYFKDAQEVNHG